MTIKSLRAFIIAMAIILPASMLAQPRVAIHGGLGVSNLRKGADDEQINFGNEFHSRLSYNLGGTAYFQILPPL